MGLTGLCNECEDARHRTAHPLPDPSCFACKCDTLQIQRPWNFQDQRVIPKPANNSWESARAGEHRPDGTFMPYLKPDFSTIGVKEYADRRGHLDTARERNRAGIPG